jgi:N-hydroxyarylamine O-acetyltransferase
MTALASGSAGYVPDLDAYFARIGYRGSRAPTLETLHAISLAQVQAIPFEALDVLLGRRIDLDPRAVEDKLVHRRRGGYCFEQNTLLLRVLAALGYEVQPISARVRWGRTRDYVPPRTHVLVRVELGARFGDDSWLVDCGIGTMSLTSAIRLVVDEEQATAHEPRRLVAAGSWDGPALSRRSPEALLYHQVKLGEEWHDVAELTLEEMHPIDREVGNWYTSAHPGSSFRQRLLTTRATPDGRLSLFNRELTRRGPDGVARVERVASPEHLLRVLADEFGLEFPEGTRFACDALVWD